MRIMKSVVAVAIFAVCATIFSASPQASARDDKPKPCDPYEKHTLPYVGARNDFSFYGGPERDPLKLDGDRDGFPCERLMKYTPVENDVLVRYGSDGQTKKVDAPDDGPGRTAFREAFWNSTPFRGGASGSNSNFPQPLTIQAARKIYSEFFGPAMRTESELEVYEDTFDYLNNYKRAMCFRQYVLGLIYWQNELDDLDDEFYGLIDMATATADTKGYAQTFMSNSTRLKIIQFPKDVVSTYRVDFFKVAGEIGKWALDMQLHDNVKKSLLALDRICIDS